MTARRPFTLLGVPIDSVGTSGGTELGPAKLRELLGPDGFEDAGDTSRQIHGLERDITNGWLAFDDVVAMTAEVRDSVASLTAAGRIPVVLGGCCTLLPAALAGARASLGEIGLAYLDGHLDLFTGVTSPTGEGADMPVATILGLAPDRLLDELGDAPVVPANRMALLGARDEEELEMISPLPKGLGISRIEYREDLRRGDLTEIGAATAAELTADGSGFWLHLDLDVLDRDVFPATDYLMPDGLNFTELKELMTPLAASPGLVGVDVTCFNPEKDPDDVCGTALAGLLRSIL